MSLKLFKFPPAINSYVWLFFAAVCLAGGWMAFRGFFFDAVATNLDISQPTAGIIVDGLRTSAAWDPNAHLLAGVYYEKNFEAMNLDLSTSEYRLAAERSPDNYLVWLDLAQALSRSGDVDGAEIAFRRAQELAPNYAAVQWAYGNFLIRQGRDDEGFPLISRAAIADPELSGPAVATVLQMNNGDVNRTRDLLGNTPAINSGLAQTLASMKNYDAALAAWQQLPIEMRQGAFRELGTKIEGIFIAAGRFRSAAAVSSDLAASDDLKPAVGKVMNGSFENAVKPRNATEFEWTIGEGPEPQIGLSASQHHGGTYSLAATFNSFNGTSFRDISQLVPVEPGARYRLDAWYRSTLKTDAKFKWAVVEAGTGKVIATTGPMDPAGDWTSISVTFSIAETTDG
ncbi:MAG: tetratricopeptide repeat protein, partial [Acidobacteria bacterium]|nr:tetratricopeptide repeat protein [Acidobacteriota bacterium]